MPIKKIINWILGVSAALGANFTLSAESPAQLLASYLPESCYQAGLYQQQKSLTGMTKVLETSGNFAFACDKGLLWHTGEPLNETLVYQLQGNTHLVSDAGSSKKLSGTLQRQLGKMLNQLIGGNQRYLDKTFFIAATDAGVRLTPRAKRMEKFLRAIDISRSDDSVTIRMQHQGAEFTQIRVFQLQTLERLDLAQCAQLAPSNATGFASACTQLLGSD